MQHLWHASPLAQLCACDLVHWYTQLYEGHYDMSKEQLCLHDMLGLSRHLLAMTTALKGPLSR